MIFDTDNFNSLAGEILQRGGLFRFQARGYSMRPFVRDGAVITVAPTEAGSVRFGDVVFHFSKGRAVVHRVVGKDLIDKEPAFLIRGDEASSPTETVLAAEVIGKVVSIEQDGKIARINNGLLRVSGIIWAGFPYLGRLLRMINGVLRTVVFRAMLGMQSLRLYRRIANAFVGRRVKYRTAIAEDALDISRLLGYSTNTEMSDPTGMVIEKIESAKGPSHVLVASLGDRIIGTVVIQRFPETVKSGPDWWISDISVRSRYQGAGIGRGLVIKALLKAEQSGASGLGGDVSVQNKKSVRMCENLRGLQMKLQDYSKNFSVVSAFEVDQHIIFHRSIKELLQELKQTGVLDRYRGTGCLEQT